MYNYSMTILFNLKKNKRLRKNLRKQDILSEKILWAKLSKKQQGYKFRRQFGIGDYIVDFYCPKLRLVIEIDGATHSKDDEIRLDNRRQGFIESLGLVVKRYTNIDMQENLSEVMADIQETCFDLNNKITPPNPPLGKGRE